MSAESYTASDIKVLEGLEAVRKRPAMYIGDTSAYGLHQLVYEAVDNSVDEALAGSCDYIKVILHSDGSCSVGDNGRGIPVDIHKESGKPAAEVVLTVLHSGGKFDHSAYKVSGGLHGVGISVVNALSEWLEVEIRREGKEWTQRYERGVPKAPLTATGTTKKTGTIIRFKPDATIFEETTFSFDTLSNRLRELAFLNRGLKIVIEDERDGRSHTFFYKGGIVEFVKHLNQNKTPIHPKVLFFEGKKGDIEIEVALQYNDGYQESVFSFANNINTREGGTHLTGFRAAVTSRITAYAEANGFLKGFKGGVTGDDVREGLTAVVSVRLPEPQFEGQTKAKLGNSDIKGLVQQIVNDKLAEAFEEDCHVLAVYHDERIVAGVLSFFYEDQVLPYYGGAIREAFAYAVNDFMYWELMCLAAKAGIRIFDFGRSREGTGSYDFKRHWGFEPVPLPYQYVLLNGHELPDVSPSNPKLRRATDLWKRLPLHVTNRLGPMITRYLP